MEKEVIFGKDVNSGDICVYSSNGRYIIKVDKKDYCNQYIDTAGRFYSSGGYCNGKWIEATEEEKLWLEMAIQDGQTISLDRVKEAMRHRTPSINNSYSLF